jgi:hypothetical protein
MRRSHPAQQIVASTKQRNSALQPKVAQPWRQFKITRGVRSSLDMTHASAKSSAKLGA